MMRVRAAAVLDQGRAMEHDAGVGDWGKRALLRCSNSAIIRQTEERVFQSINESGSAPDLSATGDLKRQAFASVPAGFPGRRAGCAGQVGDVRRWWGHWPRVVRVRNFPVTVFFDDAVGLAHHPMNRLTLLICRLIVLFEDDKTNVTFDPHPNVARLHHANELRADEFEVFADVIAGVLTGSQQVVEADIGGVRVVGVNDGAWVADELIVVHVINRRFESKDFLDSDGITVAHSAGRRPV